MGTLFFIDYLVSFIILLAIHAPWWAWLIYVGSALFWVVVLLLCSAPTRKPNARNKPRNGDA